MYEHRRAPLAPPKVFYKRVLRSILLACSILAVCLLIGIVGYRFTCDVKWIDALHNASMILSGMGPVIEIRSAGGKIFSSCYALFSGIVFISNIGVILAPVLHRLYHRMHLEDAGK
jgi:hypothetical protein